MLTEEDKALIIELGLQELPAEQQELRLAQFYDALHKRVAMAIEDTLSAEQLERFEAISDKDDAVIGAWLQKELPDYEQLVANERAALVQEIKQTAARIRAIAEEQRGNITSS